MENKEVDFKHYFDDLADFIQSNSSGHKVYYMPNPGNWGDGLINHATLLFLDDYGIKYEILPTKKRKYYYWLLSVFKIKKNSLLLYGGGGGWNKLWGFPFHKFNNQGLKKLFNNIIVLPSTFVEFIDNDKFNYFARDKFESLLNNPKAKFCPDMALYLATKDLSKYKTKTKKVGHFYRTDKESSHHIEIPNDNVDISFNGDYLDHYDKLFKDIGNYETIYTDRLHICITGFLLDVDVYFFNGAYFKNEAIYKSIFKKYKNIHFE